MLFEKCMSVAIEFISGGMKANVSLEIRCFSTATKL